ncbi:hypothetical protein HN51_052740 [Arachis hypogaea]|uniref:uncharacterized methyltransferase At1g78140, chloroplastic n=1 Tax=Arachis ipaensis TaxID=130454 RepID=UPI0007AFBF95|nr:uncharacterized methyltransferase At1g78140, chloroplastic [Arachis ipaensis]XP_025665523.1 uncharacterized methyltransferase At1g78140, chloroplastic isoform X2 [Arachis hypogaea]QHN94151.1 putative methyltransferase [Arachis hypogaea]
MPPAMAVIGNTSLFSNLTLSPSLNRSTRLFFISVAFSPTNFRLRAASASSSPSSTATFVDTNPTDSIVAEKEKEKENEVKHSSNLLACPVCYDSLNWTSHPSLSVDAIAGSSLQCGTCKKTYVGNQTHLDLTVTTGAKSYGEPMPFTTEFFRLPLISALYERGWRQSFVWGGYPGPEKEFELMKEFLKPVLGGNIIDASCASGLFSRLFAKSGWFSLVVALDYSENMLKQCYEFIQQEENFPKENITLVRADISRLPFVSSSVDAVHAGAALHCWPSPLAAVAEISRVLRPGGVFVATTIIIDGPFIVVPFRSTFSQSFKQVSGSNLFLSERELEELCSACGLVGFKCIRNGFFVMISATKPS